jgi:hemerythrin-like metal-binding protein
VIGEVDDIVSAIATAVDAQTSATAEISENVTQASTGIAEVNRNVAHSSRFSHEIASDIAEVNRIAGMIAENSGRVSTNAGDLTRLAEDLKKMIGEFKVDRSADSDAAVSTDDDTELITWDDSIQFGIDAIDGQHRRLVDLINQLHRAMRKRAGKIVIGPILDALAEYTARHFKAEEQLMAKSGYAELEGHKRLHEKLVGQVLDFKNQFESGSATVTLDLMTFLSGWLVNHIKGVDRKYLPALKGQRL